MKFNFSFLSLFLLVGCVQEPGNKIIVDFEKVFDSIPSASGLAIKDSFAYVVCDDGTGLYKINSKNFHWDKIPLKGLAFDQYREDKSVKHDFESASLVSWQGRNYLVALGSGSGTVRDSMLMINTADYGDQKIYSLEGFYRQLAANTSTAASQLNIEGLTVAGDSMMILNRGNNLLITCNTNDFLSGQITPQIKFRKIQLPSIQKHEARLSGICTIDDKHLLFCASVEDTPDWTKDGPVLGSFFGIYSLRENKVVATYLLKDQQGKTKREKIESVEILQKNTDHLIFLAVADNDNGTSKLFQVRLQGLAF